ncbi:MAG: hypothetical protein LBR39_00195 [Coriobacteriales bacterium]|jgi:hypothetical protein|nr:hypothetical protein [Coriobacteriales bacterium]
MTNTCTRPTAAARRLRTVKLFGLALAIILLGLGVQQRCQQPTQSAATGLADELAAVLHPDPLNLVASCPGLELVGVRGGGRILGYAAPQPAAATAEVLSAELLRQGWMLTAGNSGIMTFERTGTQSQFAYSYLLVQCLDTSSGSTVVIQAS